MTHPIELDALRAQPFYRGQILRVRDWPAVPAEECPVETLFSRMPRLAGGSLASIFSVLNRNSIPTSLLAALGRAFPESAGNNEDAVLCAPQSDTRELFWRLVCLVEALDESRLCLVLCADPERVVRARDGVLEMLRACDVEYAAGAVALDGEAGFSAFGESVPLIVALSPESLRSLLYTPQHRSVCDLIMGTLGRVVVPNLESWPTALASNTAHLLRQLHLECARRGRFPSLACTISPVRDVQGFVGEFWGKPVEGAAVVEAGEGGAARVLCVNYAAPLARDPANRKVWVRGDLGGCASDLLGWLVGKFEPLDGLPGRLHYVIDVSGSMGEKIGPVREAVLRDIDARVRAGRAGSGMRLAVTTFDTENRKVVDEEFGEGTQDRLRTVLETLAPMGGTNLPAGLAAALQGAVESGAGCEEIVLFSDGYTSMEPQDRRNLLEAARRARAAGCAVRLLYVLLDMDPPAEVRNLVRELGGSILVQTTDSLGTGGALEPEDEHRQCVVFLSGEGGMSDRVIQAHQGGRRRIVFTRDIALLEVDPAWVIAVVVSGRFAGIDDVRRQVAHLGRDRLAVFILTEADASAQLLVEDHPPAADLRVQPLLCPSNPGVIEMRFEELPVQEMDTWLFRYLLKGKAAYQTMLQRLGYATDGGALPDRVALDASELPNGFELIRRDAGWVVGRRSPVAGWGVELDAPILALPLDTWTRQNILLEGEGVTIRRDAASARVAYPVGAPIDSGSRGVEVRGMRDGRIELGARSGDRIHPLLRDVTVEALDVNAWAASQIEVGRLGQLALGPVRFNAGIAGSRRFPRGNLDDLFTDEMYPALVPVRFESVGLRLVPEGGGMPLAAGIANLLRLTLPVALRFAGSNAFVFPGNDEAVWVVDLAPGGNGAAASMIADGAALLRRLLELGAWIAFVCPCEMGFAGANDAGVAVGVEDNGCPRCARAPGPVLLEPDGRDRFRGVTKKDMLAWLQERRYAPCAEHLTEKYEGVTALGRVNAHDQGTRRGIARWVRRILHDRLGVTIPEEALASFDWMPEGESESGCLGRHSPGDNRIQIRRGLKEWLALDTVAHELFHNVQYGVDGLFDHSRLGHNADPKPPYEGKLFIEGAAMWAESHVVDALALRTALDLANLRQGDEYGDGFQLFKWIEEGRWDPQGKAGGVAAVLEFLRTGDIAAVTGGTIEGLARLYAEVGIARARQLSP